MERKIHIDRCEYKNPIHIKLKNKDFELLIISIQNNTSKRYFAIRTKSLPNNADSVYFKYNPRNENIRWLSGLSEKVVDITALYPQKKFKKLPTLSNYPEFERAGAPTFEKAWKELTMQQPKWEPLPNRRGANTIIGINNNGIIRISSNDIKSSISIDKFRFAYNNLLKTGYISRKYINEQVKGRCSSCIVSVLEKLPFIEATSNPRGLKLI